MNQEEIYRNFAEKFYNKEKKLTPYTEDMILQTESLLGYTFPEDYKRFLMCIGPQSLYNLDFERLYEGSDDNHPNCLLDELLTLEEIIGSKQWISQEQLIPFVNDGNGNYYCFNINEKGIFFWDHESPLEQEYIAESFLQVVQQHSELPTGGPEDEEFEEYNKEDFKPYTLFITDFGPNRTKVLLVIREITKWTLVELRIKTQHLPCPIISERKKIINMYANYLHTLGASISLLPE